MVRVALHVQHLRRNILRPVSDRINNRPAAHRAIRTRRPRLVRSRNFKYSELGKSGLQIEPENSGSRSADGSELQKVSAGSLHGTSTPWDRDERTAHGVHLILPISIEVKCS